MSDRTTSGGTDSRGDQVHFRLAYRGGPVEDGTMPALLLADALVGIERVCQIANGALNPSSVTASVRVDAKLRRGSFEVSAILALMAAEPFLTGTMRTARDLASIIGIAKDTGTIRATVISAFKQLKGEKPTVVRLSRSEFRLETRTASFVVDEPVALLVEAFEGLRRVAKPLGIRGMEKLEVVDEDVGEIVEEILAGDVPDADILPPLETSDSEIEEAETLVEVVAPDLHGGFAWRLTEGDGHSFTARLLDTEFAAKVASREVVFGNGDRLRVKLRKEKRIERGKLHTEKAIARVVAHYPAGAQGKLL